MRWLRCVGAVSVALGALVSCSSDGGEGQVVVADEPTRPGWEGYVTPEVQDHLGSAIWNGEEMVLVAFDKADGSFRNVVSAYDPAVGAWRSLPDLPTDVPVTVNGAVASRHGVLAQGLGCDPAVSEDHGDGLRCLPGDVRTFLLPPGEDAFVEVDAPGRSEDEFGPVWLAEGTGSGDPHLVIDGSVHRLTDATTWELVDGLDASGTLCEVGGEFLSTIGGPDPGQGLPSYERLARFDEEAARWIEIELPVRGSYGTLHCGSGRSARFEIMNEQPVAEATYLITADAPPVEVDIPGDLLLGTVTFVGDAFLVDATRMVPGQPPSDADHQLYMLDESSARLIPTDLPSSSDSIEVHPLDGEVGLFQIHRGPGADANTFEVRDLPAPGS